MPHPARHSRPKIRQQEDQHALGSLLDELGTRRAPAAHRLVEDHAEQRGYGNGAARASTSYLNVPQQMVEHAAAAHRGCEQHAFDRAQSGATVQGAPTASAAEDPKRALVHALQKDICALKSDMSSRMSVLVDRLDELLSA